METIRAGEDFDAARFRAFRRAILRTLTRQARGLLSADEVRLTGLGIARIRFRGERRRARLGARATAQV